MALTDEQQRAIAAQLVKTYSEDLLERTRAQQRFSEEALKALILINGGALIALFTLIGHAVAKGAPMALRPALLWWSFIAFAAALFMAMVTYLFAFLSQAKAYSSSGSFMKNQQLICVGAAPIYDGNEDAKAGEKFWISAIWTAVCSAGLFLLGAAVALTAVIPT